MIVAGGGLQKSRETAVNLFQDDTPARGDYAMPAFRG